MLISTHLQVPDSWVLIFTIGAVDVKLTEEEKKELEAPYMAQVASGHS